MKTHLPTLATTLTTKPLTLDSTLKPTPVCTHARRQTDQQTGPESTRACSSVVSRCSSTEPQPTVCMYWQVHWHFRLDVFIIGKRRFVRSSSVFEVLLALSTHSACLEDLKESSMPTRKYFGLHVSTRYESGSKLNHISSMKQNDNLHFKTLKKAFGCGVYNHFKLHIPIRLDQTANKV